MLRPVCMFALAIAATFAATGARAGDEGPVIVIPSRPGIPVVINGVDASFAVVEGDWGLARPGAVPVTVIGGSPLWPNPIYSQRNSYHPRYGRPPPLGRMEAEPPMDRPLPEPAEPFSRSWSSSSDVQQSSYRPRPSQSQWYDPAPPATITDPATFPENFNPPVVVDPRRRRHH